jgi:hypothetical protein
MPVTTNIGPCECCGETVTVACCADPIPPVLTGEITAADINGNCAITVGTTFTLTYNASASPYPGWEGPATSPTGTFTFYVYCDGSQWIVLYTTTCGQLQPSYLMTVVCDPFLLTRIITIRPNATPTVAVLFTLAVTA